MTTAAEKEKLVQYIVSKYGKDIAKTLLKGGLSFGKETLKGTAGYMASLSPQFFAMYKMVGGASKILKKIIDKDKNEKKQKEEEAKRQQRSNFLGGQGLANSMLLANVKAMAVKADKVLIVGNTAIPGKGPAGLLTTSKNKLPIGDDVIDGEVIGKPQRMLEAKKSIGYREKMLAATNAIKTGITRLPGLIGKVLTNPYVLAGLGITAGAVLTGAAIKKGIEEYFNPQREGNVKKSNNQNQLGGISSDLKGLAIPNAQYKDQYDLIQKNYNKSKNSGTRSDFSVSEGYGAARSGGSKHSGTDYRVAEWTPITSPFDGTVYKVWNDNTYGGGLSIQLIDKKKKTIVGAAHLRQVICFEGQAITKGQVVAFSGGVPGQPGAGSSTGAHVHQSQYMKDSKGNWVKIDPESQQAKSLLGGQTWMSMVKADYASGYGATLSDLQAKINDPKAEAQKNKNWDKAMNKGKLYGSEDKKAPDTSLQQDIHPAEMSAAGTKVSNLGNKNEIQSQQTSYQLDKQRQERVAQANSKPTEGKNTNINIAAAQDVGSKSNLIFGIADQATLAASQSYGMDIG